MSYVVPLFVPGDRPERFTKAAQSGCDAVIIDLEDAVRPENKGAARAALRTDFTDLPILVRVNGTDTEWYDDDIAAVAALDIAGIILPKAEAGLALSTLAAGPHPIHALIESAAGLVSARETAQVPGVRRLIFGSVDFSADLGMAHEREFLRSARAELVLASRYAGIEPPVDGVTLALDDPAMVEDDARYAMKMGFSGKLAIHPRQVEPIKTGFRPSDDEIAWARDILALEGGATVYRGRMIDAPVKASAARIVARAAL